MSSDFRASMRRREFVKQAGTFSILGIAGANLRAAGGAIAIVSDSSDSNVSTRPVKWAISELQKSIEAQRTPVMVVGSPSEAADAAVYVAIAGRRSTLAQGFHENRPFSGTPEAFSLRAGKIDGKVAILICGADSRGFMYGLLELADRVRFGNEPAASLMNGRTVDERPANEVRSITRAFVSDIEDKPWFYDRSSWRSYLSELAANRFNRFNLAFGIGYDFPRGVVGDYFHFIYPYLFAVPGYNVRVVPLSNAERDKNLDMLKFITDETAAHGLHCQIGIWTHAYQWVDSPHADHRVEGLTPEIHAAYCRDAVALLLKSCPAIQGITLRVHGESGIPEGSYSFWQTLFQGISGSGRPVEIDMHAKGLDSTMINSALKTGMPVKVSPKFWAEHMGLAYHQAAIREEEMPRPDSDQAGVFKFSNGARRFLRYGYGDLFKKERKFGVLFRIWPGTQRVLLWGDPALASGYGRASHFCGASGVEICEPLFFKGRQGSGLPGGRCAYADETLRPKDGDWSKYRYSYRVWGHNLYNPDANPEEWRGYLRSQFNTAAPAIEEGLSQASRILPLLTTAHLPSAANNSYWPEIYTNMPIVEGSEFEPYTDTPSPKRFGTVSPLDPELFSTIQEHSKELLDGTLAGKYSPIEVAQLLEDLSEAADRSMATVRGHVGSRATPDFRRIDEDVRIQCGLARFFAAKLRSGVLYEIYLQTVDKAALQHAIASYRNARTAWASMSERARSVYRSDITFGPRSNKRGHWLDRVPAIDKDLAAMEALTGKAEKNSAKAGPRVKQAIIASTGHPRPRPSVACTHTPPKTFQPGESVSVHIAFSGDARNRPSAARLHYRRVDQAERWQAADMERTNQGYSGAIPGTYSKSPYALQYYFEFRRGPDAVCLYPGFTANLANQPYFLVAMA